LARGRVAAETPVARAADLAHPLEAEGWRVLYAGLDAAQARWRRRLVAAYALGSLAHGGFAPQASDVDLALILDRLDPDVGRAMTDIRGSVRERLGSAIASRLSLFWSSWPELALPYPKGRFPLVDRIDLAEAARCLHGEDRRTDILLPVGEDRRQGLVVEAAAFMLDRIATPANDRRLADPGSLLALGTREVTKAVLFPVRFLYTLGTGLADGNRPAVAWYAAQPDAAAAALSTAALGWRERGVDADLAPELLRRELQSLYLELTSKYAQALASLDFGRLVRGLLDWNARLGGRQS
jgi:hypothetical protein